MRPSHESLCLYAHQGSAPPRRVSSGRESVRLPPIRDGNAGPEADSFRRQNHLHGSLRRAGVFTEVNAAAQTPDGDLPGARRKLDLAISALIDPKPQSIRRDDGTTEIAWTDSLLDQLFDAVSGQTGERSGGRAGAPAWIDCIDQVDTIERQVAEWHPEWPTPDISGDDPPPVVFVRLRAIQARKWGVESTSYVLEIAGRVEGFGVDIKQLLAGERSWSVYAAQGRNLAQCPQCGESVVYRPGPEGKPVRHPALQIMSDGTPHCINRDCKAVWPNPQFLARLLGFESPEGLVES